MQRRLRDEDAAIGAWKGLTGQTPAVFHFPGGKERPVFHGARGRAFEETYPTLAAGPAPVAVGVDRQAGLPERFEEGDADWDLDLQTEAFERNAHRLDE
jgi:hypothetical protein